jgi:DNA-binding NarL/FixJ family response regulator
VSPVTVVLVDDQPLVRAGLARILEVDPELEVVGEASNGRDAVVLVRRLQPDVVLMDVRMPVVDGIDATRRLRDAGSRAKVVVLTTFGLDEYVVDSLRGGASGFLLKEAPPERILSAVHEVAAGNAVLDPAVTRSVIAALGSHGPRSTAADRLDDLTTREREVLMLLARGLSNAEIAERLVVGEGTVKTHVAHLLAKLGVRDRLQAVVCAFDAGLA